MPSLAEAATLFSYGYFARVDGTQAPDLTDRRGASTHQVAAALIMDLVIHDRLRLEQPYVLGRLKRRRGSYGVIATGVVIFTLVVMLALFFVPIFVFASSFPALSEQMWAAAAYVGIYYGIWAVMLVLLFVFVGRPLNRWLSGKMELVEPYDADDLRQLAIQHVQRLGQKRPTFDYVRYAFKGREQRELREKYKQQLVAQGCLVEQVRPADLLLRAMGDGRAVNREHPVWLALHEQLRALILERRVVDAQTAALAIILSARGGPDLTKQTSWTVAGLYQCFAPHEYAIVTARRKEIIGHQDTAITAAIGAERYDALLAIRAVSMLDNPYEM